MPPVSLVVCVYKERDLLERLLQHVAGCYDDLVVVHDGSENAPPTISKVPANHAAINFNELKENAPLPEGSRQPDLPARAGGIQKLVRHHGGHYYEGPRAFQQEPHWPFAWGQAKHDWILRLDADEFPSEELRGWLQKFRQSPEPPPEISGYTCIWPLWNGRRAVTKRWPTGRFFLFHRQRVRFFGMAEQTPMADGKYEPLFFILHHQPKRKSYGVGNLIFRRQAYHWRRIIAISLLGQPTDLPCWRWTSAAWPPIWEEVRQKPLRTACKRLFFGPMRQARDMWQAEKKVFLSAMLGTGAHQFLMGVTFFFFRRRFRKKLNQV